MIDWNEVIICAIFQSAAFGFGWWLRGRSERKKRNWSTIKARLWGDNHPSVQTIIYANGDAFEFKDGEIHSYRYNSMHDTPR